MKTVTAAQIAAMSDVGNYEIKRLAEERGALTAADILSLPYYTIRPETRLWVVLREEFIEAAILHEFACWCADRALNLSDAPSERSISAILKKQDWMNGLCDDKELAEAREAAYDASSPTLMTKPRAGVRRTVGRTTAALAAFYAAFEEPRTAAVRASMAAAETTKNMSNMLGAKDAEYEEQCAALLKRIQEEGNMKTNLDLMDERTDLTEKERQEIDAAVDELFDTPSIKRDKIEPESCETPDFPVMPEKETAEDRAHHELLGDTEDRETGMTLDALLDLLTKAKSCYSDCRVQIQASLCGHAERGIMGARAEIEWDAHGKMSGMTLTLE